MRKYGWYADTWPELAMNIGTWASFLALGAFIGPGVGFTQLMVLFAVGAVLGVAGQLTWAYHEREDNNA